MEFTPKFYKANDEINTYEVHVPAPYLRMTRHFAPGSHYELTVCGLGFYELFVNGQRITKGLLAPYISNPDDLVYFDRYDVTDLVTTGENSAIGLILGNGMQNAPGGRVWDFDVARFRGPVRFAVQLTETLPDGTVRSEDLGCLFKTHPSPILFDDLRSGCFYDANKEIPGWDLPAFDDGQWSPVQPAEPPRGEYRLCAADPIRVTQEIAPVEIREAVMDDEFNNRENMRLDTQYKLGKLGQKGILFDFGVNTAGICRLVVDGRKGQEIYIQFCELQLSDGKLSYKNTGSFYPDGYGQSLLYICKGEKGECFEPPFCYFGYRYAMVYGLTPEQVRPETLTMLRASSDLGRRGSFDCSDPVMNALGEMSHNSDLSNFYYFPTDCPHREKNGWTGDAAVSAEHMILTLTPEDSYVEWLRNICKSQLEDGSIPGIIPTTGWGYDWCNGPAWDNALSEICWQMWRLRGDLRAARNCSEALMRHLSYLAGRRDADGLTDFGLGDWVQPGKDSADSVAPVRVTNSCLSMYIARKSADLFEALGLPLQRAFAQTLADELREAMRAHLIDFNTMTVLPRCQTDQAMFLYYGVFEPAERRAAGDVLREIIREDGDHLNTGMLGLRVVFHVLSDLGYGDLAYRMITREDYPSYGMFVRRGYTALAEDFFPDSEVDRPSSLNHHFFGDIQSWFMQRVAGLRVNPQAVSPDRFEIRPDFIKSLDYAEAKYEAPCGTVRVRWEREGVKVRLTIEAPEAASGRITLPAGYVFDAKPRSRQDGSNSIALNPGTYLCRGM